MALSVEQGALKLYALFHGHAPIEPNPAAEQKLIGRPPKKQHPYRFQLIGVKSVEEIRAGLGICGAPEHHKDCCGSEISKSDPQAQNGRRKMSAIQERSKRLIRIANMG